MSDTASDSDGKSDGTKANGAKSTDTKSAGDPKSASDKAGRIRAKISASQARSRGEAPPRKTAKPKAKPARRRTAGDERNALERALDDHPLVLLAGSVALGAIAASFVPRSVTRKLGGRILGLAALAGELGSVYGGKAWGAAAESARAGQGRLEDLGETLADQGADARRKAIELGGQAARRALELAEVAAANARESGGSALKRIGELSDRVRS